jgi:Tol biopolymer transport system component
MRFAVPPAALLLGACASAPAGPELFAPGAVSTEGREFATTFARDGGAVYFNVVLEGRIQIFRSTRLGGLWGPHEALSFSDGSARDVDPFVTVDGRIVYSSDRPLPDAPEDAEPYHLWQVRPTADGWSAPEPLPSPPNDPAGAVFATFTDDGTVYLGARRGDEPRQLYVSRFVDGAYRPRERVDLGLGPEVHVGNPLIAPDESFLVFTSRELGGAGEVDLILTERLADGSWSTPRPLPPPINSPWSDFAPGLGTDGRTLYFTSERPGMVGPIKGRPPGDLYRVSLTPYLTR